MSKLAVNGGKALRDIKTNPWPKWPVWDEKEEKGLLEVLRSGVWSYNGPKELEFNKAFAKFIGAEHALSVANGTVSLQLAGGLRNRIGRRGHCPRAYLAGDRGGGAGCQRNPRSRRRKRR